MRQVTAKSVEDVLRWVETTPHHIASWIDEPGFFVLKGHSSKLRISETLQARTHKLIEPGGSFDNRMYRATKAGRARLRKADNSEARS